ncbi:MAG: SIR2 family protein [Brevundimonas sp.]|uniref:SIR2 family protein n=1 Tax=Brevundimonas sp. TaxID=1871086 RepID=UPI00391C5115
MPITMKALAEAVVPRRTVLLFGAGSSIPSGAPSVEELIALLGQTHNQHGDYSLSELTGILEARDQSRRPFVATLRKRLEKVKPTGGLINLPRYDWKSIYTTNYDRLVEMTYGGRQRSLSVVSSNFDFTGDEVPETTKLFKLHGTIEKDVSDGHAARLIITEADYERTEEYREQLYYRLGADLAGSHLVIIGHSLADPHIRAMVNKCARINTNGGGTGRISLLLFEEDPDRARLWEERNIRVCFGGIDQFFAELAAVAPDHTLVYQATGSPLDGEAILRPTTVDVGHAVTALGADVSAMFNGWPATYADVAANLTFERGVTDKVIDGLVEGDFDFAVLLGASGLGKTTAARQALYRLRSKGWQAFEHKGDHTLQPKSWVAVAAALAREGAQGVLFVDEAHNHLSELNQLIDDLAAQSTDALKIVMASSRNHWGPRVKSPNVYKRGKEFLVTRLSGAEIDRLLNLVDTNPAFKPLMEDAFSGFSSVERRRRLTVKCESETFVCLRNIFASERFDDIILREYAALSEPLQEVYRLVAAMESAGIRVHRQLVIRLLSIDVNAIAGILNALEDIVAEYSIDDRQSVYGWRGRHPVIVDIIARYKFNDIDRLVELFERVIDSISATYEVEIRSLRELCNLQSGLSRIPDKRVQNRLLRRMMSVAPSERVPRHRLVRNLIDMGEYEKADTEIKIFESDFRSDGPMARYKISLMIERALHTKGVLPEDRVVMIEQARSYAASAVSRYRNNKNVLSANCDVGVAYYKLTGEIEVLQTALKELKAAEVRLGDPEISRRIRRFERMMSSGAGLQLIDGDEVE